MTQAEESVADDPMRAEVAKLLAETAAISREGYRIAFTFFAGVITAALAAGATLVMPAIGS